jgi:hypothetical protein
LGQAINAVTGTRLWALSFLLRRMVFKRLPRLPPVHRSARFIPFSAHPQVMQQHCQLAATAMMARFFPFRPPRSARLSPQRRRSQSAPNGPRMCCAPCTSNVRQPPDRQPRNYPQRPAACSNSLPNLGCNLGKSGSLWTFVSKDTQLVTVPVGFGD